jgi:hypothetical protein
VKLPNPQNAVVDVNKLRDYCLSLKHPRGRHKARVFVGSLGLTIRDAEVLRAALLRSAIDGEAIPSRGDLYGQRYMVDLKLRGSLGAVTVRDCWIVLAREGFPRMTTCYVL